MSEYVKPSLKKELMDKIQRFIEDYPEYGYRSLAQFVEDATRRRADELRVFELTPRFEHMNTHENRVTVRDKKLPDRLLDIFVVPVGEQEFELRCGHCDKTDCEHVRYVLTISEKAIKPIEKRGWRYRAEN